MITIYGKPDVMCFGCKQTKRAFSAAGVEFEFIDITDPANQAGLEYITEELGYMQAPVVVVTDDDHWSGLDPANIERVIAHGAGAS